MYREKRKKIIIDDLKARYELIVNDTKSCVMGIDGSPHRKSEEIEQLKEFLIENRNINKRSLEDAFSTLYEKIDDKLDVTARTRLNDALSVWFIRASSYVDRHGTLNVNDLQLSVIFESLVAFIQGNRGAVVNSLEKLLHRVIDFLRKTDAESFLLKIHSYIDAITNMPMKDRSFYFLMERLAKESEPGYVLGHYPKFAQQCIDSMCLNHLASAASKAFASIFSQIYLQGKIPEWIESWRKYVEEGLEKPQSNQNVQTYLLPALIAIEPKVYEILLQEQKFSSKMSDKSVGFLLGLLEVGRKMGITTSVCTLQASYTDILLRLADHSNAYFRIKSLTILLSSYKQSTPIDPIVLEAVRRRNIIKQLFKDVDQNDQRDRLFSLMRLFMIRLRDSSYSICRDLEKTKYRDKDRFEELQKVRNTIYGFLLWLMEFLKRNLLPGSAYFEKLISLKSLGLLVELNIDHIKRPHFYEKIPPKMKAKADNNKTSFPFSIQVYDDYTVLLLLDNITSNYEDISKESVSLLFECPRLSRVLSRNDSHLIPIALDMINDLAGRRSDRGAKIFQIMSQTFLEEENYTRCIDITKLLLARIDKVFNTMEQIGVVEATVKKERSHGYLTALNLILESTNDKVIQSCASFWGHTFHYLVTKNLQIWALLRNLFEKEKAVSLSDREEHTIQLYAWRLASEVSYLLVIISSKATRFGYFLEEGLYSESMRLMTEQLSLIKHTGAIASIRSSFVLFCKICLQNNNPSVASLPRDCLSQSLDLIMNKSQLISRRSAGIPFLVSGSLLALNSYLSISQQDELNSSTMNALINILYLEVKDTQDKKDVPQVHALNCLKAIFADSLFFPKFVRKFNSVFELALTNIDHSFWPIRNSAMMLFSALHNSLFTDPFNGATKLSSTLFFSEFIGLERILYSYFHTALSKTSNVNAALAILTIFSRVESAQNDNMSQMFNEPIVSYMAHKDWRIREMSSLALATYLNGSNIPTYIDLLVEKSLLNFGKFNSIHGTLIFLQKVLTRKIVRPEEFILTKSQIIRICELIYFILAFKSSRSYILANASVNILRIIEGFSWEKTFQSKLFYMIAMLVTDCIANDDLQPNGARSLFLLTSIEYLLSHYLEHESENLVDLSLLALYSSRYELQLTVLDFWIRVMDDQKANIEKSCQWLGHSLWELLKQDDCWSYVKKKILFLMGRLPDFATSLSDEQVKSLFETLSALNTSSTDQEVKALILAIMSSMITRTGADEETELINFITSCYNHLNESNERLTRQLVTGALIKIVHSCKFEEGYRTVVVLCVLFIQQMLYDSEDAIREETAEFFSSLYELEFVETPTALSEKVIDLLFERFTIFEISRATSFYLSMKPSSIIGNLDLVRSTHRESIYEVEPTNLYKNDIEALKLDYRLIEKLSKFRGMDENTIYHLCSLVHVELSDVLLFIREMSKNGSVAWHTHDLVFTAIVEVIMKSKKVLQIKRDIQVETDLDSLRVIIRKLKLHFINENILETISA